MKQPYFSIVIPTKNRPDYLKYSIASVLMQNFDDYELIVSDNYNDEKTKNIINQFKDDTHLIYIRTDEELNMNNHWEWATKKAKGKYVILLPDRKLLIQNALKKLHNFLHKIHNDSLNCISFGVKSYNEIENKLGWNNVLRKTQEFSSEELIENFLNKNYFETESLDTYFPKTLNGCFKNEYVNLIRQKYGHYFNTPYVTTPDYSSLFINLAVNKSSYFFGEYIILAQGEQDSNGKNFGAGKYDNYLKSLGINNSDLYTTVPIKAPFIYNWLTNDFIRIKNTIGGNLTNKKINLKNYYSVIQYELDKKKQIAKVDNNVLNFFSEEFNKAFSESGFNKKDLKENYDNKKTKSILSNIPLHIRDYIRHNYSDYTLVNKIVKYKFKNALEAAGFSNTNKFNTH